MLIIPLRTRNRTLLTTLQFPLINNANLNYAAPILVMTDLPVYV
jgi:hypothetical protein